jgi:hypothetical protein
MPMQTSRRWLSVLAAPLVWLALATSAAAVPVTYTVQGTLDQLWGADVLGIDGATLTLVVDFDTTTVPVTTYPPGDIAIHTSYELVFSNRPGGAPDVTLSSSYDVWLYLGNSLPPNPNPDSVFFDIWTDLELEGTPIFVYSVEVLLADVFPGSGLPSLSTEWGPSDVVEVDWFNGFIDDPSNFDFSYQVLGGTATAEVPEPRAALLLGGAAAALGLRRGLRPS